MLTSRDISSKASAAADVLCNMITDRFDRYPSEHQKSLEQRMREFLEEVLTEVANESQPEEE